MNQVVTLTELLTELASAPELQDDYPELVVVWGDVDDLPCRNRNAVGFYSKLQLRVEPMYLRGEELGFVSRVTKNCHYMPGIETCVDLYDTPSEGPSGPDKKM